MQNFECKIALVFISISLKVCFQLLGALKNRLNETVLLNTHNIFFLKK